MKKIIAVLICLCLCASFSGCSSKNTPSDAETENKEDDYYENICVDITTEGDGFYSTFADVTVVYHGNGVSYIVVENPTVLAFKVSDKYDGGVCLIDGAEIEQMIHSLTAAMDSLGEDDTGTASYYISILLELLNQKAIYDYCPT